MKKICLSFILILLMFPLTFCKGNLPHSIEVVGTTQGEFAHLIDRQIMGITLNTSEKGYAILEINTLDKIQIGEKILEIPWKMKIRIAESDGFNIVK